MSEGKNWLRNFNEGQHARAGKGYQPDMLIGNENHPRQTPK